MKERLDHFPQITSATTIRSLDAISQHKGGGQGWIRTSAGVFQRSNEWLRRQGVENVTPLRIMRKEIGSIIASEHGIFEASRYLRHSDIRITSAFYADKKRTVTPKVFSGLLSTQGGVVKFQTATDDSLHASRVAASK